MINKQEWSGISLPAIRHDGGYFNSRDENDMAWSSIVMIIGTPLRSRVMQPDFGSIVPELVFEQNTSALISLLTSSIREAVSRWEQRVVINDLDVTADDNIINITLSFSLVSDITNIQRRSLELSRFENFRIVQQFNLIGA